ncbi:hypothetical protein CEUSTIGMA_g497.t1 [Chlamydomonas eustigma]|uniref:Uncharacterized protein n=1 Tax=Chlamydomonas eustigma TaxID=1157962 RepID=A0A250WQB4_9CHLO|nr:hypothetical protein CEUSTIGMA_g497.t1 [Chlamydomonas eustigma]|eukprot:GAX73044.1 hypothetical protein CEUSTIGMA_g497.t1 [Chlamydomonas eustigma]
MIRKRDQEERKNSAIELSLVDVTASDCGSGRVRLHQDIWTELGIPFHKCVKVTTSPDCLWTFICVSSIYEPNNHSGGQAVDPRVVIPPLDTSISALRSQLKSKFDSRISVWPSTPVNALQINILTSPGILGFPVIQLKLHQLLITPGSFVLLGGDHYIKVLSATPNCTAKEPLYRITAATRINILGEGEDQISSTPSSPSFTPHSLVLNSTTQTEVSSELLFSTSQLSEDPTHKTEPGFLEEGGELSGTIPACSKAISTNPVVPSSNHPSLEESVSGPEVSRNKSATKKGRKKQDRGTTIANSKFNLLLNLTED